MKYDMLIIYSLVMLYMLLQTVKIFIESDSAPNGAEYYELEQQIAQVNRQNLQLNEEYLYITSLSYINRKARSMGFIETKKYIYL
jgi:hypothetical protein